LNFCFERFRKLLQKKKNTEKSKGITESEEDGSNSVAADHMVARVLDFAVNGEQAHSNDAADKAGGGGDNNTAGDSSNKFNANRNNNSKSTLPSNSKSNQNDGANSNALPTHVFVKHEVLTPPFIPPNTVFLNNRARKWVLNLMLVNQRVNRAVNYTLASDLKNRFQSLQNQNESISKRY
jgi:hypothetical protein